MIVPAAVVSRAIGLSQYDCRPRMRTRAASAYWWKRIALAADCRCWATESAMSFRAAVFSEVVLAG